MSKRQLEQIFDQYYDSEKEIVNLTTKEWKKRP